MTALRASRTRVAPVPPLLCRALHTKHAYTTILPLERRRVRGRNERDVLAARRSALTSGENAWRRRYRAFRVLLISDIGSTGRAESYRRRGHCCEWM